MSASLEPFGAMMMFAAAGREPCDRDPAMDFPAGRSEQEQSVLPQHFPLRGAQERSKGRRKTTFIILRDIFQGNRFGSPQGTSFEHAMQPSGMFSARKDFDRPALPLNGKSAAAGSFLSCPHGQLDIHERAEPEDP